MKNQFNKYLVVLGGILAPMMVMAQTGFTPAIPDGAYRGKFRGLDTGRVNLLTQSIRGCEGCFIAVLFKNQHHDKRIETFKALPIKNQKIQAEGVGQKSETTLQTSSEYDLIPLAVDTDGEMTTPNDNPSLVLTVQKFIGTTAAEFVITSAQSDNKSGTQSSMIFTGGASSFDLDDGEAGRYKAPMKIRSQGSINIISENIQDGSRSASATLLGNEKSAGGNFSIKEKAPGVFTFNAVSHLATGVQVKETPEKIIIFMKKLGRERAYLVNPNNSTDIGVLKVMN
jgi:hypothetical protein